ncbi:lysylphosphatidylglycerol synthase transmembrane domain-containing protein [Xanthovirga aplysinae]|uniref:lysylphosphatidylglycerol synthase transmembrane domain-containing protein n=1 Tax=Xanthovirga aplysinae TaxID=2529853 RepID=UPI0031B5DB47
MNPNKIWVPVLLGLGIVFYLLYSDPDLTFAQLRLVVEATPSFVILAFFVLMARDAGYLYRIRTITGKRLSWTSSFYVIILWEFSSAVTPSIVGGTAVAVFLLLKEGLNLGRSLAYVMLTAILDNFFFIVTAPMVLFLANGEVFPQMIGLESFLSTDLKYLFIISYVMIALYTLVMFYALFIRPRAFKWFLLKITSIRFLRKWRSQAYEHGDEIILASTQLAGKNSTYWIKIIASTIFIWSARYLMLNCLMAAFTDTTLRDNLVIFARQVIMWIVMLMSPTPGSSGTAEFFFNKFFQDYLGNYTLATNIFWRALSYYPYLIAGAIFLPKWVRRVFFKKEGKVKVEQ